MIAYLACFDFGADASVKLGDQEFFLVQSTNFTTDGFIQATATTYQDETLATYAVFTGLNNPAFDLEIIKQGGNRPAIAGLQIVETPEPSSLVLLLVGCVMGYFGRRARMPRSKKGHPASLCKAACPVETRLRTVESLLPATSAAGPCP